MHKLLCRSIPRATGLIALCLGMPMAHAKDKPHLHVTIAGLRNGRGVVRCALFRGPDGFPKDISKAYRHETVNITERTAACDFDGLAPGRYAVAVFHDENENGKLDTNLIGMPKEPVGVSNNAKAHFGPPRFEDAAFPVGEDSINMTIQLVEA